MSHNYFFIYIATIYVASYHTNSFHFYITEQRIIISHHITKYHHPIAITYHEHILFRPLPSGKHPQSLRHPNQRTCLPAHHLKKASKPHKDETTVQDQNRTNLIDQQAVRGVEGSQEHAGV